MILSVESRKTEELKLVKDKQPKEKKEKRPLEIKETVEWEIIKLSLIYYLCFLINHHTSIQIEFYTL
jgi:hypothetical protein